MDDSCRVFRASGTSCLGNPGIINSSGVIYSLVCQEIRGGYTGSGQRLLELEIDRKLALQLKQHKIGGLSEFRIKRKAKGEAIREMRSKRLI